MRVQQTQHEKHRIQKSLCWFGSSLHWTPRKDANIPARRIVKQLIGRPTYPTVLFQFVIFSMYSTIRCQQQVNSERIHRSKNFSVTSCTVNIQTIQRTTTLYAVTRTTSVLPVQASSSRRFGSGGQKYNSSHLFSREGPRPKVCYRSSPVHRFRASDST